MKSDNKKIIQKIFDAGFLTPREKNILQKRLMGYTLEQIGLELNLTRERIRQLGVKIRKKMLENMNKEDLLEFKKHVGSIRESNKSSSWSLQEDRKLKKMHSEYYNAFIDEAAKEFGKSKNAIRSHLTEYFRKGWTKIKKK